MEVYFHLYLLKVTGKNRDVLLKNTNLFNYNNKIKKPN